MWRDTAPTRRLTLVYLLLKRLPIPLRSFPLLPLTSSFTVTVHTNISFIAQTGAGCQSSAPTPGQPHRVAPTITRKIRTTEGLTPVCTRVATWKTYPARAHAQVRRGRAALV